MAEMGLGGGGGEGGAAMLTFGEKDVTLFKLADVGVGTEGGSRIVGATRSRICFVDLNLFNRGYLKIYL